MLAFLNGKILPEAEAVVPLCDRGFLLGDGLFETVRVTGGRPFRFAQHLDRLARGAEFLRIRLPFAPEELHGFAGQLVKRNQMPKSILRLTLTRGPGTRGYSIRGADTPTLAMTLHPLPPAKPEWRLITSSLRLPAGDALAAFKTTSKVLNVLARAEAEAREADEALLLNTNGEVAETAGGNIFWISGGIISTPPLEVGALPGITRAVVLEICRALRLATREQIAGPERLCEADGVFVTQSALGIIPVAALDSRPLAMSAMTQRLAAAYDRLLQEQA